MVRKHNTILLAFLASFFIFISIPVIHYSAAVNSSNSNFLSDVPLEVNEFGLVSDSLVSSYDILKEGESYDLVLKNHGLSEKLRKKIVKEGNSFLHGFATGDKYHFYWNIFKLEELQYIVFEKDPVNYVIVELSGPVNVYEGKKELAVKRKIIEGEIKTSFYNSLKKNDLRPELVDKLSEIYQWQIDFYRLSKGDKFRFIIEEKYAGDSLIGEPKIGGAYFNHNGKEYYAIRYNDGKSAEYYDLSGKNVKRAFLTAPVDYSVVTSPYSDSRFHPILKINKPHLGTDYAAPEGTPIYSVAEGIVTDARFTRGNGNYIRILHDNVYSTQYLHMSRFAKGIFPGKRVKQGEIIGYVGSTGLATGPHLCFRFWKNGVQVNPMEEKFPSNYKLNGDKLDKFMARRDTILKELDRSDIIRPDIASVLN